MSDSDDETYTIPIKDQRYFGAGLKRKRVKFVPASSPATHQPTSSGSAISDLYLSIVGGGKNAEPSHAGSSKASGDGEPQSSTHGDAAATESAPPSPAPENCDICKLPLGEGHESSLAHQVCLQHSHPPSAIERSRKGLSFLQAQGWDPDSRKGLGKGGEGILYPIKLKEKKDTVGLGMHVPKNGAPKARVEKLGAKEVRRNEEQGKKRREQLQRMFYMNDDVLRYLGEG
ncbi:hypothetical protein MPH_03484 [Macrophomina phaseolina MS6]|uniref:G-patch domain-containing protein n=1 Tax=Macrophomina phaseolina (strain MS6) TaxID=1126212 RepID=K2S9W4_MACPH|nr:hypothetical protein MPH_03484 [Macrophomina phaseolina MS6]